MKNIELAPYAAKSEEAVRLHKEKRTAKFITQFQEDARRILMCNASRRMQGKSQAMPANMDDHVRNRYSHTVEVQHVAEIIGQNLGLNTDLIKAIAYGHDLGHTPFGHQGERTLNEAVKKYGLDGFEHNDHSVYLVSQIERLSKNFPGLNLTDYTLDGLNKHRTNNPKYPQSNLEGQVTNLADEIAYICHDLSDSMRYDFLTMGDIDKMKIRKFLPKELEKEDVPWGVAEVFIGESIRSIQKKLDKDKPEHSLDICKNDKFYPEFNKKYQEMYDEIKNVLMKKYYSELNNAQGTKALKFLVDFYMENESFLPETVMTKGFETIIGVRNHVAALTEREVLRAHETAKEIERKLKEGRLKAEELRGNEVN